MKRSGRQKESSSPGEKKGFYLHLAVFVVVNSLLVLTLFPRGRVGLMLAFACLFFWGSALLRHYQNIKSVDSLKNDPQSSGNQQENGTNADEAEHLDLDGKFENREEIRRKYDDSDFV